MLDAGLKLTKSPAIKTQMLIRRPVDEVFEAFVNPEITSRFWFTSASGPLETGKRVVWKWEMYGVSADVRVKDVKKNSQIVIEWGDEDNGLTTVEWRFVPHDNATFVTIGEHGYRGSGDEVVAKAIDSMGGFSFVLAAAKAWLEHGIVLALVADHVPKEASGG